MAKDIHSLKIHCNCDN